MIIFVLETSVPKKKTMKKILVLILIAAFLFSCSREVTPSEAANHHYKKCRDVR